MVTAQGAMLKFMLGILLREHIGSEIIRKKSRVKDMIVEFRRSSTEPDTSQGS